MAAAAETLSQRSDGLAIDARLPGAKAVVARLRRLGVRVVWIGSGGEQEDETYVPPDRSISALAEALVPGSVGRPAAALSEQQRRVLLLIAEGMTAKEVARYLAISPKTVEHHKTRIFTKLGVPNQAAAVHVALALEGKGCPREPRRVLEGDQTSLDRHRPRRDRGARRRLADHRGRAGRSTFDRLRGDLRHRPDRQPLHGGNVSNLEAVRPCRPSGTFLIVSPRSWVTRATRKTSSRRSRWGPIHRRA